MFELQKTLIIENIVYDINTNAIFWFELSKIFLENDEKKQTKILVDFIKKLNLPETAESVEEIFKFFNWNLTHKKNNNSGGFFEKEPPYCFIRDFQYIYASFLEQYNIDLIDDYLHFHKFKMLFSSLNENCLFKKIIHYRIADTSNMSEEQKKFYNEQKRIFSLENNNKKRFKNIHEKNAAFFERLEKRAEELRKWQMEQSKS